ncbi:MAG: hypothetical protein ACTHOO_03615 [Alcanivorax sp.]
MKHNIIRRRVRVVIEEMESAYAAFSEHNHMNGDYAAFTSMAVAEFRNVLDNPALTREQLESMVREGMQKHRRRDGDDADWSRFVASHITRTSNEGTFV